MFNSKLLVYQRVSQSLAGRTEILRSFRIGAPGVESLDMFGRWFGENSHIVSELF